MAWLIRYWNFFSYINFFRFLSFFKKISCKFALRFSQPAWILRYMNFLYGPDLGCLTFVMMCLQEVLLWIKSVVDECGENITTEQLKDYVWKTLNSGKVYNKC